MKIDMVVAGRVRKIKVSTAVIDGKVIWRAEHKAGVYVSIGFSGDTLEAVMASMSAKIQKHDANTVDVEPALRTALTLDTKMP